MMTSSRKWKVCATSVVVGVLVCLAGPTLSWAVNIGGRVVPVVQTNNQPSLNIQITGVTRPGTVSGRFDNEKWRITAEYIWTPEDVDPPPYTETDGWGNFQLPIRVSYYPPDKGGGMVRIEPPVGLLDKEPENKESDGNQGSALDQGVETSWRPSIGYKLFAGYSGYNAEIGLNSKAYFRDEFILTDKISIANYTSYIDWWKEGFEVQQAGQAFEQKTGNVVTGWENYWGDGLIKNSLNTAWAPADGIRNSFNWSAGVSDYWIGSENNAVTNIAPAQGLSPHTWAMEEDASPVAILYFRRAHHE